MSNDVLLPVFYWHFKELFSAWLTLQFRGKYFLTRRYLKVARMLMTCEKLQNSKTTDLCKYDVIGWSSVLLFTECQSHTIEKLCLNFHVDKLKRTDVRSARLKKMIESNSTWEGAFYQSEWVKMNLSWIIPIFSLYVCCC